MISSLAWHSLSLTLTEYSHFRLLTTKIFCGKAEVSFLIYTHEPKYLPWQSLAKNIVLQGQVRVKVRSQS